ncbi:MAG: hypothetical protein V4543_15845 [Bacteroidota bacterium]
MICLVVLVGPFILLGSLGAFIFRLVKLKDKGNGTKLYASLTLPFLFLAVEIGFQPSDSFHTVNSEIEIEAETSMVWNNVKNVRNIKTSEISTHFIHLIGIPKPLDGRLDRESVGGIRSIVWEKGIAVAS